MFKKVLIVEDIDSICLGLVTSLEKKFPGINIHSSKYCDEAYLKLKKGAIEGSPFELIITDLSFKEDHRQATLISGKDLIIKVKQEFPEVFIIVHSIEDRPYIINSLFNYNINAYVVKGREGTHEITEAINAIGQGKKYTSPQVISGINNDVLFEIEDYDILLLKYLSDGYTQEQISHKFRELSLSPSSTSSIEKRINKLKIVLKANNTLQLIAISKDTGLI